MKRLILVSVLTLTLLILPGCTTGKDPIAEAQATRQRLEPILARVDAFVATLPPGPRKDRYLAYREYLQLALDAVLVLINSPAPATQPSAGAAN